MCNLYRLETASDEIGRLIGALGAQLRFPEGIPNFQPRAVRISERAPLLRAGPGASMLELVERRWSWPAPSGKPVFNFRAEGRRFAPAERRVALADGFYEFTVPADPKQKTKDRWLFTWPGYQWFGIAAIVRSDPQVGEAFTLLTAPPGPDVAPYHDRQIVVLSPEDCLRWLDPAVPASDLIRTLPAGSLAVNRG